jgi:hypothetical protein
VKLSNKNKDVKRNDFLGAVFVPNFLTFGMKYDNLIGLRDDEDIF